jgi:hypothetical protein
MLSIKAALFLSVALFSTSTLAAKKAKPDFVADTAVQRAATAYAAQAVAAAREQFGIKLDGTEASMAQLDTVLAHAHASYIRTSPHPSEEQLMAVARMYGSYLGEVYRLKHGAIWGMATRDGQSLPGMRSATGAKVWPWTQVAQRIGKGAAHNVVDYYRTLPRE